MTLLYVSSKFKYKSSLDNFYTYFKTDSTLVQHVSGTKKRPLRELGRPMSQ